MYPALRTIAAAILAISLATPAAAGGPAIPPGLVDSLRAWLDANTEYPRRDDLPEIGFIDARRAAAEHGNADRTGGKLRGLYDESSATIYLVDPWTPDTAFDISVLLHELTHHRQATAKHWYCSQEQEWRAHQIQAQWLAEQGIEARFYWPAIALSASCAKRDIHPD